MQDEEIPPDRGAASARTSACTASTGRTTGRSSSTSATATGSGCCAANGFEILDLIEIQAPPGSDPHRYEGLAEAGMGAPLAVRGDLARPQGRVSSPPAPPLLLASTSPQRRAILEQLQLPFDVVAPRYEERDEPGLTPPEVVRERARGKATSVADVAEDRPVLGVDTEVVCEGRVHGKPATAAEAEAMLEALAGRTHEVISGLCLLTQAWQEVRDEVTRVTFRTLTPRELGMYVAGGEWRGPRRRVRGPGARRAARRADRGRLPERRGPARSAALHAPRGAIPRRLRARLTHGGLGGASSTNRSYRHRATSGLTPK